MSLFQNTVLKKYLSSQGEKIAAAYTLYKDYFHNIEIQENIRSSKEEQFQEGFLRELFVKVLGYTLKPAPNYNLETEKKNETNAKKADGAIMIDGEVVGVIELKDHKTTDLKSVEAQAFGYKNNNRKASYVVISNFEKLRFYIDNTIDFIEFNLFALTEDEFAKLWLCLAYENIAKGLPKQLKAESVSEESDITKKFYKVYSSFKHDLFADLTANNPAQDRLTLFKKSQKLLDRLLFILFAEDGDLLPPNSIRRIVEQWEKLRDMDEYRPLYDRLKKYFGYMDTGHRGKDHDIFAYNGGLFKPDEVLDNATISDNVLHRHLLAISEYNFQSEVDVNILGHIFENSLTEIEEITNAIEGRGDAAKDGKRKKDGVFYTPRYITTYIVENTLGRLCAEKKAELGIDESEYFADRRRQKATTKRLDDRLQEYRRWLLSLTVCDPACGSGAFLNAALDFLMTEHRLIDEMTAKILGHTLAFPDIENAILENNLYGVDINEESVEIAKLALWLRTAKPHRKLNSLSDNIKCGNSLIADPAVAGNKAFDWQSEFPHVFERGGFDVVIGNPPYGAKISNSEISYYRKSYRTVIGHSEAYYLFIDRSITKLTKLNGSIGMIVPNAWMTNKYAYELRNLMIYDTRIEIVVNLSKTSIFEDANVENSITILRNIAPLKTMDVLVGTDLNNLYSYSLNNWKTNRKQIISFAPNQETDRIISKMNQAKCVLSDKLDISNGFKPYQVGYGFNWDGLPLNTEDVKNKIYHSAIKIDDSYKREIKGKGVHRYSLSWDEYYVKWGKWLMSPKDIHYYNQPKILVRQIISDYLFATIDRDNLYADQSLYMCTNYKDTKESLEFYLALLNSRLYGFYFRKFYSEEDDLFPKIKVNELKALPIPDVSILDVSQFIDLADKMLSLNAELSAKRARFCKRLTDNLVGIRITGALERFDELDFKQFLAELKKQKITLSLRQQDEWEEYFNDNRTACQIITTQITATDHQIDRMVYALYGLTEEEIAIIEKP